MPRVIPECPWTSLHGDKKARWRTTSRGKQWKKGENGNQWEPEKRCVRVPLRRGEIQVLVGTEKVCSVGRGQERKNKALKE